MFANLCACICLTEPQTAPKKVALRFFQLDCSQKLKDILWVHLSLPSHNPNPTSDAFDLEKHFSDSSALFVLSRIELRSFRSFFFLRKALPQNRKYLGKKIITTENSNLLCATFVDGALFISYWLKLDLNLIIKLCVHFAFMKWLLIMHASTSKFLILN